MAYGSYFSDGHTITRSGGNDTDYALSPNRSRRVLMRTPPPDMPLPAVPALPAEFAKKRSSTPGRPPSDSLACRRTCLSDKDWALNSGRGERVSFGIPTSAASSASHWSSTQLLLTPSFVTRLAMAMNTPPGSDYPSPNPMQSPVDPILGCSYFEARPQIAQGM